MSLAINFIHNNNNRQLFSLFKKYNTCEKKDLNFNLQKKVTACQLMLKKKKKLLSLAIYIGEDNN